MKEKLAPFVKRVRGNIFLVTGSYLSVDVEPLINYLHQLMSNRINRLLDSPVKILIIQNHNFIDIHDRLSHIDSKEITTIEAKEVALNKCIDCFREDYYDFILLMHTENGEFSNKDLSVILKKFSCPIFVFSSNESLINLLIS